jgi:hypothetical protein
LRLFVELSLQNAWAILLKLPFDYQVMASPVERLRMKSQLPEKLWFLESCLPQKSEEYRLGQRVNII